ncbi:hypothetical protein ccbrp13_15470 [Ktedonobacteria bacterium brp13]|nr:hypothetical protein ccbrp13_15470 [Ktedonobacteria bacterium brp13]
MRFAQKVVIITGGSKGIGAGCARIFCQEGGLVVICARREQEGTALAAELTRQGPGQCIFIGADVSQPEEILELIEETVRRFGRLDCLNGVRINAVCPAGVDTPLLHEWAATLDNPEEAIDMVHRLHKLGRMATSEEIGRVCLFLASEENSFITGQDIHVEGGATLDY